MDVAAPSAPPRSGCPAVAAMGFDVVYLPPIHPIGAAFRKGPNNSPTAGPHDPGSARGRSASADGRARRHPPRPRHRRRTSATSSAQAEKQRARGRARPRPAVLARPPVGDRAPRVVHAAARRLDRLRREPAEEVPGHLPDQLRQRPRGHPRRGAAHRRATGSRRACRSSASTTRTPSRCEFWEWLLARGQRRASGRRLPRRGVHPAGDAAVARAGRVPAVVHLLHLAQHEGRSSRSSSTELAHETADYLRPNLFVNTPDILTEYLQFGGPAGLQDPRRARRDRRRRAGASTPGYELFENVARPGSEENIDNEKYEYKQRDWAEAEAAGRSLAPYLTRAQRASGAAHPALRAAAQPARALERRRLDPRLHEVPRRASSPATGQARRDHRRRQRRPALGARDDRAPRPDGSSASSRATRFGVRDLITGASWTWGDANYVRLDAFTEPVHILARRTAEGPLHGRARRSRRCSPAAPRSSTPR